MPEMGTNGPDSSALAWLHNMVSTYQPYPPIGFAWYASCGIHRGPGFSTCLSQLPHTLAYLRSLAG